MLILFFRIAIIYITVLFSLRLMGKRQASEFQPFELAITMLIADLAVQPLSDVNIPLLSGIVPIFCLLILQVCVSFAAMKSRKIRRFICGTPLAIIENGSVNQEKVRDAMISVDDLITILRSADCVSLNEVKNVYLETSGQASVLTKGSGALITLVENGKYVDANFTEKSMSRREFDEVMKKEGVSGASEIFWAFVCGDETVIIKKQEEEKK